MTYSGKINRKIEEILNDKITGTASIGGGCISNAERITTAKGKSYFLKTNSSHAGDMFIKEAHGLEELIKPGAIRIPKVIAYDKDFILLEYIHSGSGKNNFSEDFGRRFAQLHRYTSNSYGFFEDNYIGSNPQINIADEEEKSNWTKFYFNKRILYQYKLAEKSGNATSELKSALLKLEDKIDEIVTDNGEQPSLLHGDLWGGNYMIDENGDACLIDPAVYYGNREADLAMTKLFGGFDFRFYAAYNEAFPLPAGYDYRENIYKLYHVLNHLNLFGGGYYSQAIRLMKYYL